jgi:hypothetical protein
MKTIYHNPRTGKNAETRKEALAKNEPKKDDTKKSTSKVQKADKEVS